MTLLLLYFLVSASSAEDPLQAFATASNLFTPSLYKEVAKTELGNFLVSPFSAETILALTQSGCKNETAEEIRAALRLPPDDSQIESAVKALLPSLTGNEYALHTANKIYIKENFSVNAEFRNGAVDVYQSEIENIDFDKREEAAKTMNEWVESKTENKIKDLIDWRTIDNTTRAFLISALYFRGRWSVAFPPMLTRKADFYKNETEMAQVDTMYLDDEEFLFYECPHLEAKFLELPFKGEGASMTIVLPNKKDGLASLESNVERVFTPHNLTKEIVNVALPKFKIETRLDLKTVFQNLGVVRIFDEEQADLSGIAGEKGDLVVSGVVQKTFIDLDESGVEVAGSTYIPVIVNSMAPPEGKSFVVDHPFVFYVKVRGVILFAGRVLLPL